MNIGSSTAAAREQALYCRLDLVLEVLGGARAGGWLQRAAESEAKSHRQGQRSQPDDRGGNA